MLLNLLAEAVSQNESRFASIVYTNQQGETSLYLIHLNCNLTKLYNRDIKFLQAMKPEGELQTQAHTEVLASLKKSVDTNFQNPAYTKLNYYTPLCKSIKYHKDEETGDINLYVNGYVVSKQILVKGEYKEVKSKPLTIEKNNLRKQLKSGKYREFKMNINQIHGVRINGKTLVLDTQN